MMLLATRTNKQGHTYELSEAGYDDGSLEVHCHKAQIHPDCGKKLIAHITPFMDGLTDNEFYSVEVIEGKKHDQNYASAEIAFNYFVDGIE